MGRTKTTPRWLDADEMAAWRNYVDTVGALNQALEADLQEFGLTIGDYEVLVRLSEAPERSMRMCDLAAQLRLSPSGLTRRLDGLVRTGVVARSPSADDRRVMLAVLTDEGHALLERAAPRHVDSVRRHFIDLLSPAEVKAFGSAFGKVRTAIASRCGEAS
ncbi:MAG: MarR family winged helix-turn-helix transcriptional regulator [Ilumatobacteraceae bacterium]